MAKKIKFPLEMENGVKARNLEELRDNFSLEKVISHYISGKLAVWLNDRYHTDKAKQIEELDINDSNFKCDICKILEVGHSTSEEISIDKIKERNLKIRQLKQTTNNEKIIKNIDRVVFKQEEMEELINEGINEIYLFGKEFTIPLDKNNITYIGVNKPVVVIQSKKIVDFLGNNIILENVSFDEEYEELVKIKSENDRIKEKEKPQNNLLPQTFEESIAMALSIQTDFLKNLKKWS